MTALWVLDVSASEKRAFWRIAGGTAEACLSSRLWEERFLFLYIAFSGGIKMKQQLEQIRISALERAAAKMIEIFFAAKGRNSAKPHEI